MSKLRLKKEPWLTPDANRWLADNVSSQWRVLEFGVGGSTYWLTPKVQEIFSVEHDARWANFIAKHTPNANILLLPRPYNSVCERFSDEYFDLVMIDGRDRMRCLSSSIPKVKVGGHIVIDNMERDYYSDAYTQLKDWKLHMTNHRFRPKKKGEVNPWQTAIWTRLY